MSRPVSPPHIDSPQGKGPVAVIGGGFAGLAAATALAEAGAPVHVFEARPRLGGRAATFRDPATGERIDNGQHVLAGCYTETLRFLARIGVLAGLHRPSTLRVPMIDATGRRTTLVLPPLPSPIDLLAGIMAWDALTLPDRWSVVRIGRAIRSGASVGPDETVRQWLDRHGQSAALSELFWEPLALATLNQSIDDAAAEAFVAVTARMFGPVPDAATLLIPSVPLDELYVHPSERYLAASGATVTAQASARVVFEGDRVAAVAVGHERYAVSAVICAVPWFALGDACEAPPEVLARTLADAAALGSSPIVTVNLWFDSVEEPEAFVGLPGRTFQWMFNRARVVGPAQRHLSLVSSGAEAICAMPNPALIETALRELRAALPHLRTTTLRHASVVRERRATFSLRPGSPPRPALATPVQGLWLAGDWIDTGLPATIESAVTSGHQAAAAVLTCLP